ncbi:MAG TPA: M56 family metallopeptidase, partial [Longimicrobiaceae bacterium]|nr:M56 family metallopeptidase [Longimicrobiaceae bacterium]
MTLSGSGLAMPLLDAALRGSVLILLAWGATRLMRRASAASRHMVWAAALTAVVLVPLVGTLVPRWGVLPLPRIAAPAPETAPSSELPPPGSTAEPFIVSAASAAPEVASPAAEAATASPPAEGLAVRPGLAADWQVLLLLTWLAGAGLLTLRLGYGLTRVWWLERRATEITDDEWVRAVDALTRRLRVGRIVTLLRGPGATVPMTWGLIRPVVLLPEEADAWDDERRVAVLAHELAHVRRWDALTQWAAHLALALFWFNPLVWIACRRMREEREHACDDAVLALGTQPTRYAGHLLEIVRALGTAEGPAAALAMARRSQFEGRLLAILDRAAPRGGVSRRAVLATLAVTAAVTVPLAAVGAAPPAGHAAEATEPISED